MTEPSTALCALMETHRRLRGEQMKLEKKRETGTDGPDEVRVLGNDIRQFIASCVAGGADIPFVQEREQLMAIVDYWVRYLFQLTGKLVPSSLEPSTVGLTQVGMTLGKLRETCRKQARLFVEDRIVERVYHPDWAVARTEMEQRIQQFLEHRSSAMVLTGQAGVGKTFLLCQMAKKSLEGDTARLVLPYDSLELARRLMQSLPDSKGRLSDGIGQILANDLGYADMAALIEELDYLGRLLQEQDAHLLICFDGVERFRFEDQEPERLLVSIDALIKRLTASQGETPRIRFLLTCLDSAWALLGADDLLSPHLYFPREATRRRGTERTWAVQEFSEEEFREAYQVYTGRSPTTRELGQLRDICQGNPYLLRIAADLIQRNEEVTEEEVARVFFESRVMRGDLDDQMQRRRFLAEFVQTYDQALHGVPAKQVDLKDPAYRELAQDGILVQEIVSKPIVQIILRLNPESLTSHLYERFRIA